MKKNILAGAASLLFLVAALIAPRPQQAHAAAEAGGRNLVVWSSTYTATVETASTTAKTGAVFGSVVITSVTHMAAFIVYDSSDATTSGKEVLANVSCAVPGTYVFDVGVDLGISYASSGGCKATMTFLKSK
jgi:hypothetical protein